MAFYLTFLNFVTPNVHILSVILTDVMAPSIHESKEKERNVLIFFVYLSKLNRLSVALKLF